MIYAWPEAILTVLRTEVVGVGEPEVDCVSGSPESAGGGRSHTVNRKIAISAIIAFLIGGALGPPDLVSQLTLGVMGAFLCAVPLLILARLRFVKSASEPVHTLICILVGVIAVLSVQCFLFALRITSQRQRIDDQASAAKWGNRTTLADPLSANASCWTITVGW